MLPPSDVLARLRGDGPSVVMLLGAPDTGKSTYAKELARQALAEGQTVAYVDADVAVDTIAPPACTGLVVLRSTDDLDAMDAADEIRFVGSIHPKHLVTQMVVGTARLVHRARRRADLVLLDTTGIVSGVVGETLKYHKMELCEPDLVVGLQRGSELEPLVGMLQRFFTVDVELTDAHPGVEVIDPTERADRLRASLGAALGGSTDRWRVRPTVFAPTLPVGLDLGRLDDMLVGIHDGSGRCLGLGLLDWDGEVLRVETAVGEGMTGLRLGSMRVDRETFAATSVNLREVMFGL
ncbi:MAG: Clp1/GlmU family protein [Acidimicrobiia bacterium]